MIPQTHTLQSFPEYFEATILKQKTHELRQNDGTVYTVGDTIVLREYDPITKVYSGRTCELMVTYISPYPKNWSLPGYSLLSTRLTDATKWYHHDKDATLDDIQKGDKVK